LLDGQGGDDAREIAAIMVEALRLLAVVPHVGWDRVQKEQTTKSGPRCLESHVHLLHMV
jgi:imidazoleglycerol phosphate synthase glutamine amidotransferase subunit HisH